MVSPLLLFFSPVIVYTFLFNSVLFFYFTFVCTHTNTSVNRRGWTRACQSRASVEKRRNKTKKWNQKFSSIRGPSVHPRSHEITTWSRKESETKSREKNQKQKQPRRTRRRKKRHKREGKEEVFVGVTYTYFYVSVVLYYAFCRPPLLSVSLSLSLSLLFRYIFPPRGCAIAREFSGIFHGWDLPSPSIALVAA